MQYILCRPAGQVYAIAMDAVKSVERVGRLTKVPNTKPFVKGLMNLRGELTPVIDLAQFLDLGKTLQSAQARVVVVESADVTLGLLVEYAREVREIADADLDKEDARSRNQAVRAVANVNGEAVGILDINYVLDPAHGVIMSTQRDV
ncbi:chemotaxis protein CheW [Alicyclobacillus shizuokensis]|uniref:chemotaxis protein CheW n=1 Tax=Alicyclobacillus shizuokensis TaxID=392014 RepID=UPI000831AB7F|nr:chemotaxis protein CheW [Alicyclobacillus shizuokensis]